MSMFEFFVAQKVIRQGEHAFARLIIRIAVVAVALSAAVMICAVALIAGFKKEISGKIFGFWGAHPYHRYGTAPEFVGSQPDIH